MGLFRHPCLTRGIVHTPYGAFLVVRGLVEMPDAVGETLGWPPCGGETTSEMPHASSERPVQRLLETN